MLFIELEKEHKRSFSKQIYVQIRHKILSGELGAETALPSTRELSKELSVSRNTILTAYDMLVSEGFAYSIPGSGVFVSQGAVKIESPQKIRHYNSSSLSALSIPKDVINFDSGIPALDLFPRGKWNHAATQAMNEAVTSALGYDDPQGRPELRQVLSGYLKKTRGIHCDPEQIIITAGAKQGLTLVAKCLLNSDSEVWIEDPTNDNVKYEYICLFR